jgi:hypothetical protein
VAGQPFGGADLVVPSEALFGVAGELHIVKWVRVDEVSVLEAEPREVLALEFPAGKELSVRGKVGGVGDLTVAAEGHVELARAVEKLEKGRGFSALGATTVGEQIVQAPAVAVVDLLAVFHV